MSFIQSILQQHAPQPDLDFVIQAMVEAAQNVPLPNTRYEADLFTKVYTHLSCTPLQQAQLEFNSGAFMANLEKLALIQYISAVNPERESAAMEARAEQNLKEAMDAWLATAEETAFYDIEDKGPWLPARHHTAAIATNIVQAMRGSLRELNILPIHKVGLGK